MSHRSTHLFIWSTLDGRLPAMNKAPPSCVRECHKRGAMGRVRATLLLPLLISSSFILSGVYRTWMPQYFFKDTVQILQKQVGAKNETSGSHAVTQQNRLAEDNAFQVSPSRLSEEHVRSSSSVSVVNETFAVKNHETLAGANILGATNTTLDEGTTVTNRTHEVVNATENTTRTVKSQSGANETDSVEQAKSVQEALLLWRIKRMSVANRPPLKLLIQDAFKNVTGDPQFLLDFAIIGFAKTGSTSMASWIGSHPEARLSRFEMFALSEGRPALAVLWLYKMLRESSSTNLKQGYKGPYDITNMNGALESIQTYWPKTKLLVGVRHPVQWFESYINFRNMYSFNPRELMKQCIKTLCLRTANFHVFLAGLGKTNATSLDGLNMEEMYAANEATVPPPIPNRVFLYDMAQLADSNATRSAQFGRDVQEYLGFSTDMPHIVHKNAGMVKHNDTINQGHVDLCNAKYDELRGELMKAARDASIWIRTYFLDGKDVYVSSRGYLEEILASWMLDPCDSKRITQ